MPNFCFKMLHYSSLQCHISFINHSNIVRYFLLSMFKTVVLLHIFMETMIHLYRILCIIIYIINVFSVTFDQFIVSLLEKTSTYNKTFSSILLNPKLWPFLIFSWLIANLLYFAFRLPSQSCNTHLKLKFNYSTHLIMLLNVIFRSFLMPKLICSILNVQF